MTDERRRGMAAGLAAYVMWGLLPLYWPLLEPAGSLEILAHRIAWSLVVCIVLAALIPWARTLSSLRPRQVSLLALAAVALAVNWGVYIHGVNTDRIVETSLGYFINPLVTMALGVAVLGETLRRRQWLAVGIATAAVVVLTVDYGRPPFIALTLAATFSTYGLLKKRLGVGAVESLTVETAVLFLPAVAYLAIAHASGEAQVDGPGHALLLAGAGVVTAAPLLAFGAAARRIPLTTIGLLQYLAPTLQFLIGVLVRHEPMPAERLVGFALVWTALALFTVEALAHRRRQLRLAAEATAV